MRWIIKAWRIGTNIETWFKNKTKQDIRRHLFSRGFIVENDKKQIKDFEGTNFSIGYETRESIISVEIESDNWRNQPSKSPFPPIVFLIEDYFKIESLFWFYLETLNETEILLIKNNNRSIEPLKIISRIKEVNFDQNFKKPTLELLSNSASFNIDFYSGTRSTFHDHINFWISFLGWVSQSEFEYTNLNYILTVKKFHPDNGSCIPVEIDQINNEINYSNAEIEWFNEDQIQEIYLMRKNFDDRVILFLFEEKYLIYHCWTNE